MTVTRFIKYLNQNELTCDSQLKQSLCGKHISTGCTRDVYECKLNPNFVIKIQYCYGFHNAIEFEVWEAIQFADWWAKWFAASIFISKTGRVMVQERVEFNRPAKEYPKRIPRFFTDIKLNNYGFIEDQLKCVDYGNVLSMLTGFMDKKMRRAKW